MRRKLTLEQVNDIKFYNLFQRISNSGPWGDESLLALFVIKFDIGVCVFSQGNDIKNGKMKISKIHTSDYLRLYGYNPKKVENLQSSDRKIYLF